MHRSVASGELDKQCSAPPRESNGGCIDKLLSKCALDYFRMLLKSESSAMHAFYTIGPSLPGNHFLKTLSAGLGVERVPIAAAAEFDMRPTDLCWTAVSGVGGAGFNLLRSWSVGAPSKFVPPDLNVNRHMSPTSRGPHSRFRGLVVSSVSYRR